MGSDDCTTQPLMAAKSGAAKKVGKEDKEFSSLIFQATNETFHFQHTHTLKEASPACNLQLMEPASNCFH